MSSDGGEGGFGGEEGFCVITFSTGEEDVEEVEIEMDEEVGTVKSLGYSFES